MNEKKPVDVKQMTEQELAVNIQVLQEQAKILANSVENLSGYLQELAISRMTLQGVQNLSKGDEILVPVGASTFVRARIEDTEKVIAGVGANVSMDKTIDESLATLQERIDLTQSRIKENQDAYMKVAQKLEELGAEAEQRMRQKDLNV